MQDYRDIRKPGHCQQLQLGSWLAAAIGSRWAADSVNDTFLRTIFHLNSMQLMYQLVMIIVCNYVCMEDNSMIN
jgi:hypothetical protein